MGTDTSLWQRMKSGVMCATYSRFTFGKEAAQHQRHLTTPRWLTITSPKGALMIVVCAALLLAHTNRAAASLTNDASDNGELRRTMAQLGWRLLSKATEEADVEREDQLQRMVQRLTKRLKSLQMQRQIPSLPEADVIIERAPPKRNHGPGVWKK